MKKLGSLAVWVLILAVLAGTTPCFAYVNASGWAQPELEQAEKLNLLSEELLAADQSESISRLSFSRLAVLLWEKISGQAAPLSPEGYFSDCSDTAVRKAAALGIVNGVEPGVFAPDQPIQRQQLAVMLGRTMTALSYTYEETGAASFEDDAEIASYARDTVYGRRALGILNGDERNCMNPADSITNEQAAVLVLRTYLTITGAAAEEAARLQIGGASVWLSMPVEKLTAVFGSPDETVDSGQDFLWYVYGTDTYENFFLAAVQDGAVSALYAAYGDFTYRGRSVGDLPEVRTTTGSTVTEHTEHLGYAAVTRYYDLGRGDTLYAVWIRADDGKSTTATMPHAGRLLLLLANAFRASEGKNNLQWSEAAAQAAQLHSADMADQGVVGHVGSDGSNLAARMTAAGIAWSAVGENVGKDTNGNLFALHSAWINSSGYRANLLNASFTCFGAGFAQKDAWYVAQAFYAPFPQA